MFFLLLLPCFAADPFTVSEIRVLDASGAWKTVPTSGEAYRTGESGDIPLQAGETLPETAHVVTHEAQVVLDGPNHQQLLLYEGTELVLAEWGVRQILGAVLYDVHRAFEVRYSRFEAIVEGTKFVIEVDGQGGGSVAVSRGRVRVRSLQGEVVVRPGQMAMLENGAPPDRRRWRPPGLPGANKSRRGLIGVRFGGRAGFGTNDASGLATETVIHARYTLAGPIAVGGSLGLSTSGKSGHFPLSLGVETSFGPVSIGGSGEASMGLVYDCVRATITPQFNFGGHLNVAYHLPIGDRLEVEGRFAAGWLYQPDLQLGIGAGFRF